MVKALLAKLGMLALAIGLVVWIGWPLDTPTEPSASVEAAIEPEPAPESPPVPTDATPRQAVDSKKKTAAHTPPQSSATMLDLNRATEEELRALPGIGEVLARRVIEWRIHHGGFRSVDDLKNVKGIGVKRLDRLRSLVVVDDARSPAIPANRRAG
jgi:competence protein ComEA